MRQRLDQPQSRRGSFRAHAFIQENRRQRQYHFSKDVVLGVQSRRIPDSHGLLAVVSGPVLEDGFVEVMRSVHAIERRKVKPRGSACHVQQVLHKLLPLLELAEQPKSAQHVVRVSQPAVAIVPGAATSRRFRDGRRHCRYDRAGVFKAVQFQGERRADDFLLVQRRNVASLNPLLPVARRLAQIAIAQPRQRLVYRRSPAQHHVLALGQRKRLPAEIGQRKIRDEPQRTAESLKADVMRTLHYRWLHP